LCKCLWCEEKGEIKQHKDYNGGEWRRMWENVKRRERENVSFVGMRGEFCGCAFRLRVRCDVSELVFTK